jgi:predicted XRE-type DNA-binding protein
MTPQEERNKRFDEKFADYGGEYSNTLDVPRSLVKEFIESEIDLAISDYQTNFEQKHIASAVEVAKVEAVRKFIDQEIERKNGMKKDYLWVNFDEGCGADMSDGYNQAIDEDIVHLTSLKELIK